MIEFFSGAIALGYLVAAGFFARFWRQTADRLFLAFAIAFVLLALNQTLAQWLGAADERVGYTYLLRVLGFVLILGAIIDKNVVQRGKNRSTRSA
jgi:peptidoglycan/LPS O-acetylase OafA/YrhL